MNPLIMTIIQAPYCAEQTAESFFNENIDYWFICKI